MNLKARRPGPQPFPESVVQVREMIRSLFPIVGALLVISVGGCSKRAAKSILSNPKVRDLGIVEVSDGIPVHRSLGDDRACVITPAITNGDQVRLSIAIIQTNSAGVARTLATPTAQSDAGQPVVVLVGDIGIRLIPKIDVISTWKQQSADYMDTVLPGRHMSEHQVAEIASRELPGIQNYLCQFTNGIWEIVEVQTGAWVSSSTTNVDGHISVWSTHPTRLVLRVTDSDGKVEHVKTE